MKPRHFLAILINLPLLSCSTPQQVSPSNSQATSAAKNSASYREYYRAMWRAGRERRPFLTYEQWCQAEISKNAPPTAPIPSSRTLAPAAYAKAEPTNSDSEQRAAHPSTMPVTGSAVAKPSLSAAEYRVIRPRHFLDVGGRHWIKKNIDRGAYILLEDGSLWEVDRFEKLNAMLWLPMSNITIAESSRGNFGYDYLLINTDDGESVHAKPIARQ